MHRRRKACLGAYARPFDHLVLEVDSFPWMNLAYFKVFDVVCLCGSEIGRREVAREVEEVDDATGFGGGI